MNANEPGRMERLLRDSMGRAGSEVPPDRDLWPVMLRRLQQAEEIQPSGAVPWFDWALAAGLAMCMLAFPSLIPIVLYYL